MNVTYPQLMVDGVPSIGLLAPSHVGMDINQVFVPVIALPHQMAELGAMVTIMSQEIAPLDLVRLYPQQHRAHVSRQMSL